MCGALHEARATLDCAARDRRTPLFAAAEAGHEKIVAHLPRSRANPDATKNDDSTPLIAASYFGRIASSSC